MRNLKHIMLVVAAVCLCHVALAQTPTIKWNSPHNYDARTILCGVYGDVNSGFVGIYEKYGSFPAYYTIGYDGNLNGIYSPKDIDIPIPDELDKGGHIYFNNLIRLNKLTYVFFEYFIRKDKKSYLFYITIDEDRKVTSKAILISKPVTIDYYLLPNFQIKISKDSSKIFVHNDLGSSPDWHARYNFLILDNKMEKLQERVVELPYTHNAMGKYNMASGTFTFNFDLNTLDVDNDGNVAFAGILDSPDNKDKPSSKIFLFKWTAKTDGLKEYDIKLPEKYYNSIQCICDNENKRIVVSGIYSIDNKDGLKGCYYATVDADSKAILTQNVIEAPNNIVEAAVKLDFNLKKKINPEKYDQKTFLDPYGNILVAVEAQGMYSIAIHSNVTGYYSGSTHQYKGILIYCITNTGKLKWMNMIDKNQDLSSGYLSYLAYESSKVHFIYNDMTNVDITDLSGDAERKHTQYCLVDAAIDRENGTYTKTTMISNNKKGRHISINPQYFFYKLNDNIYLLQGENMMYEQDHYIGILTLPHTAK